MSDDLVMQWIEGNIEWIWPTILAVATAVAVILSVFWRAKR